MGKRGALTADRCLLDSNPESKRVQAPAAPGFYRSCASRRTMGSAHRVGWFKGKCSENQTTAPVASVGRFIGRSFYVQAKDQLRLTWRPSAGSPHGKCTPSVACGDVCSTGKGSRDFQVAMLPYKSRSPATPEGEIFTTLNFELLMRVKVERRVNFPLRGKSPQGNRGAFPTPAGRLFGFLFRGAEL